MRIAQLANFYTPTSGGLRTAVDTLGHGYLASGHERILIVPGKHRTEADTEAGLVITLPGVPVSGGYRMVARPSHVRRELDRLAPDSVEVSDKATMLTAGDWARANNARSILFSHERLDTWLAARLPWGRALRPAIERWNRRIAARFDTIVVTSAFAADEFHQLGVHATRKIALGVDLVTFHPKPRTPGETTKLAYAGRLSPEKNPAAVVKAVELLARDKNITLDVYGTGSALPALRRQAAGLPVTFHGHLTSRAELATRLAEADIAFAPSPAETFGLSVLEALACGTPVITANTGGAPELLSEGAGIAVSPTPQGLADGVRRLLDRPGTRRAARLRAESFPWAATIRAMLRVHEATESEVRGHVH
ncbi:MAG TPA: glycosyltransferase [Pseudonocardiaceae bacterium]|jgi:alpha-1,6-mannosyltransferase|nr:glycosyltransferase [Pseudonocardiaceae bacterium]